MSQARRVTPQCNKEADVVAGNSGPIACLGANWWRDETRRDDVWRDSERESFVG